MSYYHYTKGCHLAKIVKDGIICTTNEGIEKREKPAVWLTKSQEWDSCCDTAIVHTPMRLEAGQIFSRNDIWVEGASDDYMKKKIGMCRIVISETLPTITWAKFKYVSGISERGYNALEKVSKSKGSPTGKWLCSFTPIQRKYWECIEIFVDDQWVRWDGKIQIEEFVKLCMSCNGNDNFEKLKEENNITIYLYSKNAS